VSVYVFGVDRLGAHIVGSFSGPGAGPIPQAFIQSATGAIKLFPLPSLFIAGGINTHGAAALGNLYIAPDGTVSNIDLGSCGDVGASAINDNGWVAGSCGGDGFLWRK
jgi:hypothetical protein